MNKELLKNRIIRIFFPKRCKYCGKVITPVETLCDGCKKNLPKIEEPICLRCGRSKEDCICKKKTAYFDRVCAPFYYTGAIKTAVHRMKFEGREYLCELYADDMARCVCDNYKDTNYDFICYIPFSEKDKKKRSFNQSELLARHIGTSLNIPVCDALVKLYETSVQHRLVSALRRGNVFGAYGVCDCSAVMGKNILLVDDIKTTGATLNECAKMLKICSAAQVDCICFAVAKGKTKD